MNTSNTTTGSMVTKSSVAAKNHQESSPPPLYVVVPPQDLDAEVLPTEVLTPKERRMEQAGATRERAYKALVEATGAEVMTLDKFGDEHFAPDHSTRIRASELILKMRGDIKPETVVDQRSVVFHGVSPEVLKGLVDMVSDVRSQLDALGGSGRQTGEVVVDGC